MTDGTRDLCARLLASLEAEEELYVELRELLQRERERIVALDAAGLEELVRRKEALAEEGRLLEEGRLELSAALARELGLGEPRPTLSHLCARLGEEADGLRAVHGRLVALVGAARELLEANAAFAGEAREQVRATLRLLGRLLPAGATYEPAGPAGRGVGRRGAATADPGRLLERRA
ncbi:MAG TPA: flagellar protein FlgN [Myxococcota bacterium]|jgi:hypothetical protein|nr:flagellar protein FlgN [Myxococcota bacterium]